ncbi:hypothetical protein KALB_5821 [Kutzneria albida DSM 43870]|uniref:Photosynthesis system II assembly factor Ycf48/Hcf136-like domain-containing protein n=2 Tax=Kutzneria TaxID=43356 RepID=W5WED3_9PSEU|nr:hypothetical protein KALB_5821 [Kutzneria albida DSM 43870]
MRLRTSRTRLVVLGLLASLMIGGASQAYAAEGPVGGEDAVLDATGTPAGGWAAVGPNSVGGLLGVSTSPTKLALMQPAPPALWVSDDRGRNWEARRTLPEEVDGGTATGFFVNPANPDRMLVSVNSRVPGSMTDWIGRLLSTRDRGRSWQVVREWQPGGAFQFVADRTGRTLAVLGLDALSMSTDGGATWRDIQREWPRGQFALPMGAHRLALVGDDVLTTTVSPEFALWAVRGATGATPRSERVYQPQDGELGELAVNGRQLVVTVGDQLRGSFDGGRSWQLLRTDPDGKPLRGLTVVGGRLYAGTYDNLDVSADEGRSWSRSLVPAAGEGTSDIAELPGENGGPATTLVSAVYRGVYAIDGGNGYRSLGVPGETIASLTTAGGNRGQQLLAAGVQDVFRAALPREQVTPRTRIWERQTTTSLQESPALSVSPKRSEVVWKAARNGFSTDVSRSADAGGNWQLVGVHLPGTPWTVLAHPADPDRILVPAFTENGEALHLSTDSGRTWRTVPLPVGLSTLAGDPRDPLRVWGGNSSGGLWRSEDGGLTWKQVAEDPVSAIAVDPRHPERIVVGGAGLLRSTDGGRTFTRVRDGAGPQEVRQVLVNPRDSRVWYAARSTGDGVGVLRSIDAGRTWSPLPGRIADSRVLSLAISEDGQWLFAGTLQSGVYRLRLR